MKELVGLNGEVQSTLAANQPVVALESTVIAHGLPRPQNLETAKRLEQIVRDGGAQPATIAMLAGNRGPDLREIPACPLQRDQ